MQKIVVTLLFFTIGICNGKSLVYTQTTSNNKGTGVVNWPNPAQKCIVDICGPIEKSNLYMTKYMDRLNEYLLLSVEPQKIDFPPNIKKLFDDLKEEDKKQNETALSIFRKSQKLGSEKPDGISKAIYNLTYALPLIKKIKYKVSTDGGKTVVSVDETATETALGNLSSEDRAWVIKIGKFFSSKYRENSLSENEIQSKPPSLLLKQLHPQLSLPNAMKMELEQAQKAVASLKDLSPIEKAIFYNKTSPERISLIASHIENGTVDENETREMLQWNSDFLSNTSLFRSPDSPLLSRTTPSVEEIIIKSGGVETILKTFETARAEERQNDDGKIWSCKMQYFLNKSLLPDKTQIDNLRKDINRSKQMVIKMIKIKFPVSLQQKLITAIQNTEFIIPPTGDEFEKNFSDSLKQKLDSTKATYSDLMKVSPREMRKLLPSLTLMGASKDNSSSTSNDSNRFCDAFRYSPMSDGNYTTYGNIVLSFTTATGDESSRLGTLLHELGHTVSKVITDDPQYLDKFSGVRKCLADQHTEELSPKIKKAMSNAKSKNSKVEGTYIEEDFADTIAGESLKNISGKNRWCQFLSLSPDRKQYQESTMKADDGDSHSSSLFRLLNFEVMKSNSLPNSCKKYLNSIKYKENFSNCFDLLTRSAGSIDAKPTTKAVR